MMAQDATAGPKHRSPKRRWWQRSEVPVPEPVWIPGWASDWTKAEETVLPSAENAD